MNKINFRSKYIFALSLIAIVTILVYLGTYFLIKDQSKYAQSINMAGKERMLIVRMINYVNLYSNTKKKLYENHLKDTIKEFNRVELILQSKGHNFFIQQKKDYLKEMASFLTHTHQTDVITDKHKHEQEHKHLEQIFQKKYNILHENINNYVLKLQRDSERDIQSTIYIETLLVIFVLIVLIIEAFYIFLPAENEIKLKTKELIDINNGLEKRIKEEVDKNKQQSLHMFQQSRLTQNGEMISMIAHQWRQPLASIPAISSTLKLDIMLDEYKAEFFEDKLENINELAQHLSSTIDDFRGFFKDNKKKQQVKINDILNGSLQIIGPMLKTKNIQLIIEPSDDIVILTYANEVKQVILNLLKNAEDIIEEKQPLNAKIWITSYIENNYANLAIEDNAGGIPKEILNKIFDPYFSTKKDKDGTGLGLYMSKTIIEKHCKGKLTALNSENGAKFIISLPMKNKEY